MEKVKENVAVYHDTVAEKNNPKFFSMEQTIKIPTNRRVHLDFDIPREVTSDTAHIIIQFPVKEEIKPAVATPPKVVNKKIDMTRKELDEFLKNAHTPISDSLLGILKTDMTIDEIRTARLAKHL